MRREFPRGRAGRSGPLPAPLAQRAEQWRPAILGVLVLAVLSGCIFPLLLFAIARPLFPRQTQDSLVTREGMAAGSKLIGQSFTLVGIRQPVENTARATVWLPVSWYRCSHAVKTGETARYNIQPATALTADRRVSASIKSKGDRRWPIGSLTLAKDPRIAVTRLCFQLREKRGT